MTTTTTPPGHPAADDRTAADHRPAAGARLAAEAAAPGTGTPDTAAISLRGVHKRYGAVRALDGVDLTIRPGEIVALLGPNGAGKSTAMEMMVGLARPDSEIGRASCRERASAAEGEAE